MNNKMAAVFLAGVMGIGLAACEVGGNKADNKTDSKTETYTISFNQNNGNTAKMPEYQFLGGNISGMLNYEARLYTDITLTLNEDGSYKLKSDTYTMSNGEKIEVGASDGIGLVCVLDAKGTYEKNGDGTVTTSAAESASYTLETDTYSQEIVTAQNLSVVDGEKSGKYTSDDEPILLKWVPATVFTLGENGDIVTYTQAK